MDKLAALNLTSQDGLVTFDGFLKVGLMYLFFVGSGGGGESKGSGGGEERRRLLK